MNLQRFCELMKDSSQPDKQKIKQQAIPKSRPKWTKVTALCCAIALLLGIAAYGGYYLFMNMPKNKVWALPENLKGISEISSLTPTKYDGNFIKTDCEFTVTTKNAIDTEEFYEIFEISPKVDYTVTKKSGNEFNVSITNGLKQNSLYTLSSLSGGKAVYSWAYQTEGEFEITYASSGILTDQQVWVEFSQPDVKNFEQYFSITPAIAGTFEQYLNKWLFIPSSDFESGTVYTVTIDKNILGASSTPLKDDYVFSFCYRSENWLELNYQNSDVKCDSFNENEIPSATLFATEGIDTKKAEVKTYSIKDIEKFISLYKSNVINGLVSSSIKDNLKNEMFEFVAKPTADKDNNITVKYPKKLEKGYYVSVIEIDDHLAYHIFQVNDITAFTVSGANGTGAFLYNTKTNQPQKDTTVNKAEKTDKNGYVFLTSAFNVVNTDTPYLLIANDNGGFSDYHSYLSTNDSVFAIGDTVKVWGFTQPKAEKTEQPKYAELICSWNNKTIPLTLGTTGKFECEIEVDSTAIEEFSTIDLVVEGKVLQSKPIEISSKSEPFYNVTITTNKKCYNEKDEVEFTIYAELNDGTPAENVVVTVNNEQKPTELKTNSRGLATFTETATINGDTSPCVIKKQFSFTQNGNEQKIDVEYTVFASKNFIADVTLLSNSISLNTYKLNEQAFDFKGEKVDTSVTQKIYRLEYTKSENVYTTKEKLIETNEFETLNGSLTVNYSLPNDEYGYYMVFECDKNSYVLQFDSSEYSGDFEYSLNGNENYQILKQNQLTLVKNKKKAIKTGSVAIIGVSSDRVVYNGVFDATNICPNFDKSLLHDVTFYGAYLDDKGMYKIEPKELYSIDKELIINLETSADEYQPKDTVYTSISVLGQDKKPVECELNINVLSDGKSEFFKSVPTDSAGRVKIDFDLTDVIGDRQIIITCFDKHARLSSVSKTIAVKKDVYITTYISDSVDIKDDIAFAFRVNGKDGLKNFDYTAVLFNNGIQIDTKKGVAKPAQIKTENFGKADKTGSYSITVYIKNNEYTDEANCEFFVKEGVNVDIITSKTNVVNSKINLSNFTSDVYVTLLDQDNEFYTNVVSKMSTMYNAQVDHAIAKGTAYKRTNAYELLEFISANGINKYKNDGHLSTTQAAVVSAVASNLINVSLLDSYFENAVSTTPDLSTQIAYLLFEASQKRPVLYSLNAIKSDIDSLTDEQVLTVALAYAYAGDYDSAYEIYNQKIDHKIKSANGIAYISCDTPYQSEYMTVLATILTSKLSAERAKELVKWLLKCDEESFTGLAYTEFVLSFVAKLKGSNTVIYEDSKSVITDIGYQKSQSAVISVMQSGLKEMRFANKNGKSIMTVTGKTPLNDVISKNTSYKKLKGANAEYTASKTTVNDGDTFVVTLNVTGAKGTRVLTELPHTIKLVGKKITLGTGYIISNEKSNEFEIYCKDDEMTVEFECYASAEGDFSFSPAVVLDTKNKKYLKSGAIDITVK